MDAELDDTMRTKQTNKEKKERKNKTKTKHEKSAQWREKLGELSMISVCSGAHTPFHVGVVLSQSGQQY